jgi:hypothetical protein
VLPAHSVENYLASSRVVKSVLQTDLHVVGDRALLRRLINDYEIVVNVVMEYLLPACKLLVASVGERVGNIVVNEHWIKAFEVGVSECRLIDTQGLDGLVRVDQHPSDDALKRADLFFEDRQLQLWIRGKFLLVVFKAWIDAVFEDLRSAAQDVSRINQARQTKFANYSPATLDIRSLAAKSDIPEGFAEFAALIAA